MTEKQIIINGVDVSGCEFYRDDNGVIAPDGTAERTELCVLTDDYCGNDCNCYYKQLKRLQAELEAKEKEISILRGWRENSHKTIKELREKVGNRTDLYNRMLSEYNDLKKENEKLLSLLKQTKEDIDYYVTKLKRIMIN